MDALGAEIDTKLAAFKASVSRDELTGRTSAGDESRLLLLEAQRLQQAYSHAVSELQRAADIPDDLLEAIEQTHRPRHEDRYWRKDVLTVGSTGDLDSYAAAGLDALLRLVDPRWLEHEKQKRYRLGNDFCGSPLHLVSGIRVEQSEPSPQRLARMLLVCGDHLNKQHDLEFFEAPTLVSEVAALGNRIGDVKDLGPEAILKMRRLSELPDDDVASTVYELLVGTAGLRKGLELRMLEADKAKKTPDYRVHNLGVPASIECKRRLGLALYELAESAHIRSLYMAIESALAEYHASVEVTFLLEVQSVDSKSFAAAVIPLVSAGYGRHETTAPWGHVAVESLPYTLDITRTRLFAPDYLSKVFGWLPAETEWDGLSCAVDPPDAILVNRVRNPRCLKWVSRSATAVLKKSRGVTSLWGRAMQQIPAGDLGFIYIAYPEGNRADLADARTRDIIEACQKWSSRWSLMIGATMVNRLYPRSLGVGMPDLIESTIPIVSPDDEHLVALMPNCVFVPPPLPLRPAGETFA